MKSKKRGKSISECEVLGITSHGLWLFVSNQEFFLNFNDYPWFKSAKVSEIMNVELESPNHVAWPDLDVDLHVESLKNPAAYPLTWSD